ncbi:MAG: hypothetical protein K2J82_10510 [Muribaculaceae bacterium]|nr:hypothetical protein [Muribaculaceae bacterium]
MLHVDNTEHTQPILFMAVPALPNDAIHAKDIEVYNSMFFLAILLYYFKRLYYFTIPNPYFNFSMMRLISSANEIVLPEISLAT